MSGTNNEGLSMKERTKSKFDLLLKAALDDVKGDVSKKKRVSEEDNEAIDKVKDDGSPETLHGIDYNNSDLKKLYVKNKPKEDKEGLFNAGYDEDSSQLDSKPPKSHYSLPAVFSRSAAKLESKRKKTTDVIELIPCGNLASNNVANENLKVETKNFVNSADPVLITGKEHSSNLPQNRKPRKKKKHRDKTSGPTNPPTPTQERETSFTEDDIFKQQKREEKRKAKLAENVTVADAASFIYPASKADDKVLAKETGIVPNRKPRKKHKEKSAAKVEMAELDRFTQTQNQQILSVKIHRVDRLKMNAVIKHPLVRVHIVDGSTGARIEQQNARGCTPVHGDSQANVKYILPSMTLPFKLKEKRSVLPVWEEVLHFDESFDYLVLESTNAVLFFEVLDFLPMSAASSQYNKLGTESGWYHIAWAFLKIVGANKKLNVGTRVQLQLYLPPKHRVRTEPHVLEVFHWWASCPRVPYPATLYVTVSGMDPPAISQPIPLSPENGNPVFRGHEPQDFSNLSDEILHGRRDPAGPGTSSHLQWSRLPGQSCKVPNKLWLSLKTASKGCLVAAFSHHGKWIACGCHETETSPILIYEIPSGELVKKFLGHTSLIYELQFSATDELLISASADGTVRVWSMQSSRNNSPLVLPHPSYVYTAQFHPLTRSIVVTGCYDTVIRIWDISGETENQTQLTKELEGHNAYVNSICFNEEGTKMYSGDSKGVVQMWDVSVIRDRAADDRVNWNLHKTVCCPELAGVSISKIDHHPMLCRLLIQSQDGVIRMMDEESLEILQRYKGYLNICDYLRCCTTPCGNFIFTGSEDYCVYAWNTISGVQAAIYSDLPHRQTVHCAVFHPLDHFVAFCSFGSNVPVLIYKYDPHVGQLGVSRVKPQEATKVEDPFADRNSSPRSRNLSLEERKPAVSFDFPMASSATRLESIIKKLDSVLDISSATRASFQDLDTQEKNTMNMSWGSTFDDLGINPNAATLMEVVAQYNYSPQRSDELPFRKGDVMCILDMESEQWWIGKLADGRHGYVPAKFFAPVEGDGDGSMSVNHTKDALSLKDKPRNVTALLTKNGELTFMSASDDDTPVTTSTPIKRHRRRLRKERDSEVVSHC